LGELSARHLLLALVRPIKELNGSITGTTVAHLGKRHLEGIRIPLPSGSLLARASSAFRSIAELELELERTIRVLVTTRDLLLPRLVTGRLDVSDLDLDSLLSLDEVA
jgi:type I restriction enzyme S subunit